NWWLRDLCLAPDLVDGEMYEASIKSGENGKSVAVLTHGRSEETRPLVKPQKANNSKERWKGFIFDDEDLEKPYFPDREPPGLAVSFPLSEDGECIPRTINRYLRDYQRDGAKFIYNHYVGGRGCILGDDMGLGKTIQVISFLAAVLHKTGTREDIENNMPEFLLKTIKKETILANSKKVFLIVAPLSVLYNWKDELDTWGYFRVTVLHGNKKDIEIGRAKRGKCEVALTTYETLRLCLDEINSIEWSAIIVDEAHKIKNPKAQITQAMKALKCRVRIGLTGTILQNNMEELWCVMDWAVPGCLGNKTCFKDNFGSCLERGQKHTATKRELATGRKAMRRLASKMSRWFLRRTKALISDQLPKKDDRVVYCSLTEFQQAVYQAVLETEEVALVLHGWEPCGCNSGRKKKNCCYKKTNKYGETVRSLYFSYLAILRKVANHVALLQPDDNVSKLQESHVKRVCERVFSRFPDFMQQSKDAAFETLSDPKYSGKMKVLQRLLNHCRRNKDKVLIFSISTKLLDVLERYCMASGLDYRRLDGNTKTEERVRIVKEFNSMQDIDICLVSTLAGGLGLNFVGANTVVLFDPTWNPANDLQAIDRAYRIGQCRDVKVFRLISLGTVEEIMYLRQLYKQQLHCMVVGSENAKRYFEAVQGSKEDTGELYGVHNLFRLQTGGACLTKEILEREGQVEAGVMTATTHLKEEPPAHRLETPASPEHQQSRTLTCNLNSDSEEEQQSTTNLKPKAEKNKAPKADSTTITQGQFTLFQWGFSKLLEAGVRVPTEECSKTDGPSSSVTSDSQSAGQSSDEDFKVTDLGGEHRPNYMFPGGQRAVQLSKQPAKQSEHKRQKPCQNWAISSDSEGEAELGSKQKHCGVSEEASVVMETDSSSEESDDVIWPAQVPAQRRKVTARNKTSCGLLSDCSKSSADEQPSEVSDAEFAINLVKGNLQHHTSKAPQVRGPDDVSEESDDIDISIDCLSRDQNIRCLKKHYSERKAIPYSQLKKTASSTTESNHSDVLATESQYIDAFSPSEDEMTTQKTRLPNHSQKSKSRRRNKNTKERAKCASVVKPSKVSSNSEPAVSQEAKAGSVDRLLDGMQEVAYVHSNQCVVGSSKAENRMSYCALRDVFRLRQYSQMPANVAVQSDETFLKRINIHAFLRGKKKKKKGEWHFCSFHYSSHPVTQTEKRLHQVGQTTFLIGETPQGICRKQFLEMASHFNMASVEEFANHIVGITSESRQIMLRDFYSAQHPELKDILRVIVPEPAIEVDDTGDREIPMRKSGRRRRGKKLPPSTLAVNHACSRIVARCRKKRKKARGVQFETPVYGASEDSDGTTEHFCAADKEEAATSSTQEEFNRNNSSDAAVFTPSGGKSPETMQGASKDILQLQQNCKEVKSPEKRSKFTSDNRIIEKPNSKKDSIAELLGDTSILDDLFKPKKNSGGETEKKPWSAQAAKVKRSGKDFWDILNEGNEESVRKLTDLSVVEKLCESTSLSSRKRKELENSSLWRKNDKFLWKKNDTEDHQSESTAGT
uniref:ERCC excision repair 6 like 2 n=1 Tax=Latimeria chalumnae TaxID=7897 RepID=H3AUP2_LATCH